MKRKFEVTVCKQVRQYTTITVNADDEQDAIDIATRRARISELYTWFDTGPNYTAASCREIIK